ncbi:MAG TPA: alpha-glucan family phosphorylase [Candidatus Acidoferrales bacterium]|nr:alpha-glucan family phosphorylase [Candidatus Acidoferrales bacterium]
MQLDSFQVSPALPEKLQGLREMAYNLLWTWDDDLRAVFRRLDRALWDQCYQNPVLLLGMISQQRLQELVKDDNFMSFYQRSYERMQEYLQEPTWWDKRYPDKPLIAYFSAEFGLSESLPIYSGGLGVLSGDHMKGVSDLGVPLVGVGLLYQQGYFRQYLTPDGWQQESYPTNDFYNLPVRQASDAEGKPVKVEIRMAGNTIKVQVWAAQVGRSHLFLLDTNLPENPQEYQDITDQLYGGDHETRIRQEIVLGIGGLRGLSALGLKPMVCHMNEGHSAFLSLERIRLIMKESGLNFWEALEIARAGGVFTTHTPVPAGFDVFPPDMMQKYFGEFAKEAGIPWDDFLSLGRGNPRDPNEAFNMAVLALRTSAHANAVSKLHGEVSRKLFQRFFPALPENEVPIGHVTNGVHIRNWVSREMHQLFDRYLGTEWWQEPGNPATWQPVDDIPDEELWATHERRRERLVAVARQRLVKQLERRGASQAELDRARGVLDTNTLTLGFARRFATYKRANLILRDLDRLKKILLNSPRPVQILFAGKAHPRDTMGKEVMKAIVQFCQQDELRRHAVFIEDYDLVVARYLVQGVDVWLNNPRRGLEASGTSGMKVVCNGGLNLSVLDGWWVEGYHPEAGWAIGRGEQYSDDDYQDYVESNLLYEILEKDVVPTFYDQGPDGLPRRWIAKMKKSMRLLGPTFSATRMLWEYSEKYYLPAARYYGHMTEGTMQRARDLLNWKNSLRQHWGEVKVEKVEARRDGKAKVGEEYEVAAEVRLGAINPKDVNVEVYYGRLTADRQLTDAQSVSMQVEKDLGHGRHLYVGTIPCEQSGMHGYTVRVRPHHPDLNHFAATGLITWR